MSRYNDVEISFLQLSTQSIQIGTVVICKEHQLSLVSHCLDALATKPSDRHVAPLVKWTKFMIKYSTVWMSVDISLQKLIIHHHGSVVLTSIYCIFFVMEIVIDLVGRYKANEHGK